MKNLSKYEAIVALCLCMAVQMFTIITTPMSQFMGLLNGCAIVGLAIVCCEIGTSMTAKATAQKAETKVEDAAWKVAA